MPELFIITNRVRSVVLDRLPICADTLLGTSLSVQNLPYLLRVALTNDRFHKTIKSRGDDEISEDISMEKDISHDS